MNKLQYLTLATVIAILGLGTVKIAEAKTSIVHDRSVSLAQRNNIADSILAKGDRYYLAQKSSDRKKSSETEDEMIKELQKRDRKIEGFKDMLKIDGILPDTDSTDEDSIETGDEMMDALEKRQQKIKNLKELKQVEERLNNQKIDDLQEQGINVENTEDLKKIQAIVNNDNLDSETMLNALQKQNINIKNIARLEMVRAIVNGSKYPVVEPDGSSKLSAVTAFRMFTIGIPATILVFLIGKPVVKGIAKTFKSNLDEKFGKPKVPDGSITLHDNAFKKITIIGNKAKKINDDKFGNEEFKLLIQIKIDIAKKTEGYVELAYGVELLKAAIIAQKSFLKLESIELRYRSRKQQEFYKYVADNVGEDIDKEAFAKKVKKKQIEILPLITTEEGRVALESYAKEINIISQYDLGLKLLSLFKQYDLKDFSILKSISDTIEDLQGQDLFSPQDLISLVLEKYEAFEKLAPILDISEAENSPSTYARILQVIGLENRHGKSYLQFKQLVELLKSWEKPYKTINMVREEYTPDQYQIPAEFKQDIPGIETYRQYAKYLADL